MTFHRRLLPCLLALTLGACVAPAPPPPTFAGTPFYPAGGGHFTVIGDLQGTLLAERLFGREDNDPERARLLPEVARTNPAFVVMLGDLVSWGASEHAWQDFDRHTDALRRMGTPVLAVPGNHDYYGGSRLHQYFARFPQLRDQNWYERRYGELGMIFLDSNARQLGADRWAAQQRWYQDALKRFDADPSVLGVLVFLHHAPLTNSSVVGDNAAVREAFLPDFFQTQKTIGMVTGHAHGYERFEQCGKAFIVSAGGGGPRTKLPAHRRHRPEKFMGPAERNFNFVELSLRSSGLRAEVVGLPKGGQNFCRMEAFDLPWPEHQIAIGHLVDDKRLSGRESLDNCYPALAESETPAPSALKCPDVVRTERR
ncbi:MAG: metallophosphoesterase [Pseudomonadota bacterium]